MHILSGFLLYKSLKTALLFAVSTVVSLLMAYWVNWQFHHVRLQQQTDQYLVQLAGRWINPDIQVRQINLEKGALVMLVKTRSSENSARLVLQMQHYLCQTALHFPKPSRELLESDAEFMLVSLMQRSGAPENEFITSYPLASCKRGSAR